MPYTHTQNVLLLSTTLQVPCCQNWMYAWLEIRRHHSGHVLGMERWREREKGRGERENRLSNKTKSRQKKWSEMESYGAGIEECLQAPRVYKRVCVCVCVCSVPVPAWQRVGVRARMRERDDDGRRGRRHARARSCARDEWFHTNKVQPWGSDSLLTSAPV